MSLPPVVSFLLFVGLTMVIGLAVQILTYRLHARLDPDERQEIEGAIGNLFRVAGWLFTLVLSLTFTDVIRDRLVTETAVEKEAAAISEVHTNLRLFGIEETAEAREHLADYARSVIEDDWPALARGRPSERTGEVTHQLLLSTLALEPTDAAQEALRSRLFTDLDLLSDHRKTRVTQSREQPPAALTIVYLGYLVTMVYFGVYRPRRALLALLSLYTVFVGATIYLIIEVSQPFQGGTAVTTEPIEYVLEAMKASDGG